MKQRAGMMSRPSWLPNEERQQDRVAVNVTIDLDGPARSQSATLVDLSHTGCRLQMPERLSLGAFITVRLTATCDARGWVAWSRGSEAGVDFAVRLPDTVIDDIIALGGSCGIEQK